MTSATPTDAKTTTVPPRWNLADFYAAPDDPRIESDLDAAAAAAKAFKERHAGNIQKLDGAGLADAVAGYEAIIESVYRVMSYASLLHAADTADPEIARMHQGCRERATDITGELLFFTLDLNRIEDDRLAGMYAEPALARYRPWIDAERQFKPYQLDDAVEQMLHEKYVTGGGAWTRLFEETLADLRFPVGDDKLTLGETLNRMVDVDPAKRAQAAAGLSEGLNSRIRLFSLVTNTLAKDKEIDDRTRGYRRPMSWRNLSNQVEDEVVDALVSAVNDNVTGLSHRYYKLKAKWFGVDALNWWDRNAPLPKTEERTFDWPAARDTVLGAYGGFSPEMAANAKRFFDESWIDAGPRAGKNSGAFAHPTVPSAHPYILMNFFGKPRDVMTLAHELGHGVHQLLAGPQGTLLSSTPLTLAETASVFGEMLTFRAVVDAEKDPKRRRVLLAGKVEDMLNTVVRQIAFHNFEACVHGERQSGELTAKRIGEIWMETQAASLGPGIRLDDAYRPLWSYIPHFVNSPFYVYAYAFGDCLVNALYGVYRDGHPKFQQKYMQMLAAGGTLRHRELLAPFGLDAGDPKFWNRGLDVISGFIDELEAEN